MAREFTITENETSFTDGMIEVISSLCGIGFAFGSGYYLNQILPVAANAAEEVIRKGTIGLGSFTLGTTAAKAVNQEMTDLKNAAVMARLVAKGKLSSQETTTTEVKEEAKKVSTKK